jgi:exopolysaccharide production protein ExoQ
VTAVAARLRAAGGRAAAVTGRGLDRDRVVMVLVALAFLGLSAPEALNFFRLLPVGVLVLVAALHLAGRAAAPIRSVRIPAIALLLLAWFAASILWSDGTAISIVEVTASVLVMAVGVVVGTYGNLRALVGGVLLGGLIVLVLSLIVAAVDPAVGLMPAGYQGGSLRGIYDHRNGTASVLGQAYPAALAFEHRGRYRRIRRVAAIAAILVGVLLTSSSTALAAVAVVTLLAALFWIIRRVNPKVRPLGLVASFAAVGGLAWLATSDSTTVFALLQRDSSLTGRTLIWEAVGQLIDRRPLTGYGWGATWAPTDHVRRFVSAWSKFDVPSAHSGYLDALVQVGAVGLALLLALMALVLLRGLRVMVRHPDVATTWAPLYVGLLVVHNISETNLVEPLVQLLLVATLTRLIVIDRAGEGAAAAIAAPPHAADTVRPVRRRRSVPRAA